MSTQKPSFAETMGQNRHEEDDGHKRFTILIADDNKVNADVLKAQLTNFDAQIIWASDGCKAVSIFKKRKIDLILMDINMPLMDGFQATKEIRAWERKQGAPQTPVVAVTAHIKPADQHICIAASMNDYLPKPVKIDVLQRSLKIWAPGLSFVRPPREAAQASVA